MEAVFADGSREKVWCTFDEEQSDINCESETAKEFIRDNLTGLCRSAKKYYSHIRHSFYRKSMSATACSRK